MYKDGDRKVGDIYINVNTNTRYKLLDIVLIKYADPRKARKTVYVIKQVDIKDGPKICVPENVFDDWYV